MNNPSVSAQSGITSVTITSAYRFRWIQKYTAGITTDTWKDGMITKSGISNIVQAADYSRGGNTSMWEGCAVTIVNSISGTQFWKKISDAGISFNGLRAEIVEIDMDTAHAGTRANEMILRRGITENPSRWTETNYTIPVKDSNYKRKVNISTLIDNDAVNGNYPNADDNANGKAIPVCFGLIEKAKFVRTSNLTHVLKNSEFINSFDSLFGDIEATIFPIVGNGTSKTDSTSDATLQYTINICNRYFKPFNESFMVGKFIQVVQGKGVVGASRKIASVTAWQAGDETIQLQLSEYFEETLMGNSLATKDDQTWIKFINVESIYSGDVWPCIGFLDEKEILTSEGKEELYAYTDEKTASVADVNTITTIKEKPLSFIRLPTYAYKNIGTGTNNSLTIVAELFNGTFGDLDSYLILPVRNIILPNECITGSNVDTLLSRGNGVFYNNFVIPSQAFTFPSGSDILKWIDTDYNNTAGWELQCSSSITAQVAFGIQFELPLFPNNFSFDSCYLLTKIEQNVTSGMAYNIYVRYGKFKIGSKLTDIVTLGAAPNSGVSHSILDNIADFYFVENAPTNKTNKNFYTTLNSSSLGDGIRYYTGINNSFQLTSITNEDLYKSVRGMTIFVHTTLGTESSNNVTCTIKKILIAFKKSISIKDAIYSNFKGRIFNDTWGGRKTSAELIEKPIEVFEHILRLQNWNDTGNYGTPGLSYASNPQINTGTTEEGMFEYPTLNILKNYTASRQVINYDDANTDELLKSLCQQYFLANYQDNNGKECVALLGKIAITPDVSIDLSDILPGSIGQVEEDSSKNIFVQPYFQFNMDYATGEYKNVIRITNVDQSTFDASYVTGFSGYEAEEIWNRCHALWDYFRVIEDPPSEVTDCPWIGTKLKPVLPVSTYIDAFGMPQVYMYAA
ncbi:MAG: hypothetical protein WC716_16885, partial [Chitinophagaceae bacterium]